MDERQALRQFGISEDATVESVNVNPDYMQTWRVGDHYYLKRISENKKDADRIVGINALLRREGVPAARYLLTPAGEPSACVDGHYYTLAEKLPGEPLQWRVFGSDIEIKAYTYGQNLARLHATLKKAEGSFDFWDNHIMDELHGWILTEIRIKISPSNQKSLIIANPSVIYTHGCRGNPSTGTHTAVISCG